MPQMQELWQLMHGTLDDMGKEAITPERPYGLRCYCYRHDELFPGKFRNGAFEEPITDGLKVRLCQKGIIADTERYYPNCQDRCDLVIQVGMQEELWIECKTAYREDLNGLEGTSPRELRGRNSWVAGVRDIAERDIIKLNRLRLCSARYVGILLLGFDRVLKAIPTDQLYGLLPTELGTWEAVHGSRDGIMCPDRYPGRAQLGYRDRFWFWYRPVTQ